MRTTRQDAIRALILHFTDCPSVRNADQSDAPETAYAVMTEISITPHATTQSVSKADQGQLGIKSRYTCRWQLDFYSDSTESKAEEWAKTIDTIWRHDSGYLYLKGHQIAPLYTVPPQKVSVTEGEYTCRYMMEIFFDYSYVLDVPQEYFEKIEPQVVVADMT